MFSAIDQFNYLWTDIFVDSFIFTTPFKSRAGICSVVELENFTYNSKIVFEVDCR
jgi:hypothetical protein